MTKIHDAKQEGADHRDSDNRFYIFDDVAELFWPGDLDKGNHSAEERVIARMVEKGSTVAGHVRLHGAAVDTPHGRVFFDSESDCFECHAPTISAVRYVLSVIEEIAAELDKHRAALA